MLFDLKADPNAERNLANGANTNSYDEQIFMYQKKIGELYGFAPDGRGDISRRW